MPDEKSAGPEEAESKRRIFTEEVKQLQVSHWDFDYLPREQLDQAMSSTAEEQPDEEHLSEN